MIRHVALVTTVVFVLLAATVGPAGAQAPASALDLPPGVAVQAQPLLDAMMAHMQASGMSPDELHHMVMHMQTLADQLPQGIFLQILQLMLQLDMDDMMVLHHAMHEGNLLQQPPGQILGFVRALAS